jgi:hypothetical protein
MQQMREQLSVMYRRMLKIEADMPICRCDLPLI